MPHHPARRLSFAALAVAASLAAAGARAGGMPPEEEIDANGEPVAAVPAAADAAEPARPISAPSGYTLAAVSTSQAAPELRAASALAPSLPDPFRDHR